jgi:hypothetical protein
MPIKSWVHVPFVPLIIPGGWIVHRNNFSAVEPIVENGVFVNSSLFDEDLLWIERLVPEDRTWPKWSLDMGWYAAPSGNIDGNYRLELVLDNWETILKTYTTRDYKEMQSMINHWLRILTMHPFDESGIPLL